MTLPGVDVASFQGLPSQWQPIAGAIDWAAVKITELQTNGNRYVNPDAAPDWAALRCGLAVSIHSRVNSRVRTAGSTTSASCR